MSQTPETGQPPRKRRWFRFSLRTLVVAVLLAGSAMGLWWRWEPWVLEWHVTRWQERKDGGVFAPKIAVSRDGSRFITINGYLTARMWDGETGRMLDAIRDECQDDMSPPFPDWKRCQGTWAAAFSKDGSRLLTACQGGAVTLRRAADGKELGRLRGHGTVWIFGCGFSPDSGHIVTY